MEENKKMELLDFLGGICFAGSAVAGYNMDSMKGSWGLLICIIAMASGIFCFAMSAKSEGGV